LIAISAEWRRGVVVLRTNPRPIRRLLQLLMNLLSKPLCLRLRLLAFDAGLSHHVNQSLLNLLLLRALL
jgi:hypothetical protein